MKKLYVILLFAVFVSCKETNEPKFPEPEKPFPNMIPARAKNVDWSDRRDVDDRLTPYNWLTIQEVTVRVDGEEIDLTIPRRCMHCQNPPCANLCPWGSARKLKNGITIKNRLFKSAMSEQLGDNTHAPTEKLVRLYHTWAGGGVGLSITGNVMVDRSALGEPRNVVLDTASDLDKFKAWATAGKQIGRASCRERV